jgi:hypothetical protein
MGHQGWDESVALFMRLYQANPYSLKLVKIRKAWLDQEGLVFRKIST